MCAAFATPLTYFKDMLDVYMYIHTHTYIRILCTSKNMRINKLSRIQYFLFDLLDGSGPHATRLRASAQHLTPVAAAGATSFPSVPSAHRDGYAAPKERDEVLLKLKGVGSQAASPQDRGPRFNLLPPPPDRQGGERNGEC